MTEEKLGKQYEHFWGYSSKERMTMNQTRRVFHTSPSVRVLSLLGVLRLGFVSDFALRISDLPNHE
jgi:hypothetical protein